MTTESPNLAVGSRLDDASPAEFWNTDVLVVGGGTGGTAAAIQAARCGVRVVLATEFAWLGGMLTAAGVCAPDGNELAALQTGLWGAFLRELRSRQPGGLDCGWVSFFAYEPAIGAQIFADWVAALPNLRWVTGVQPVAVARSGDRITGVTFDSGLQVAAQITIDGTELGDLLALGDVPHRWGWEWHSEWQEPTAPEGPTDLTDRFPVQAPTWVVYLQDFGEGAIAPEIPPPPDYDPRRYEGAFGGYASPQQVLDYGRIAGDRFMLNWPQAGNDYGDDLGRLVGTAADRAAVLQGARDRSLGFAHWIQQQLGRRYGLAADLFPETGALALYPYFRESRRLRGLETVTERQILPVPGGWGAPLPRDRTTGASSAIAYGNYPNDHHYPGESFPLAPKSLRWGGRWTGTAFALPYGCLVPEAIDGFLVCDKNSSVSHIANGATRLQPVVLGLGQAAGMAAALCVERGCQPRSLPVADLQAALLHDPTAPAAVVPCFGLTTDRADWRSQQQHWLAHPQDYDSILTHEHPLSLVHPPEPPTTAVGFSGQFSWRGLQDYALETQWADTPIALVTLHPWVNHRLSQLEPGCSIVLRGRYNPSGHWIIVEDLPE
ncbi:MAG TPA: FAD-dependent oxidoreductase [Coleofasciculaceae cyanobacterium]